MKCIILAAGRGERMMPLTTNTPKPLLKIKDKTLIDYVLQSLPDEISEIIIVVKYLSAQIMYHVGQAYRGRKVKYVEGSDEGNAYSFLETRKHLNNERFLLIYGDEMPTSENVDKCMSKELSVLVYGNMVKDGVMVLNTDIFNYEPQEDGQFSTMVDLFIKDHTVSLIKANYFVGEINTPDDIKRING